MADETRTAERPSTKIVIRRVSAGSAFSRWAQKHPTATGTCTVPVQINRLSCGCAKNGAQLQVQRFSAEMPWACCGCGVQFRLAPHFPTSS